MKKGLLSHIFTFGSWTLLSRVLGLVRDVVVAVVFGAGVGMDAFLVAFKIPNFMRRLFGEGAFSQAFVPVLSEYKSQRSEEETRRLVSDASGTLGAVLLLITVLGVLGAPWVVGVIASGFVADPDKYALTVEMLRYTFPYILLISLTACAGGVLNTYGRFGPPAFAPVLLNVVLIGAALLLAPSLEEPIVALAIGVLIAGFFQLALQIPYLGRIGMLAPPRWGWRDPGVRRVLKLMAPILFGSSVVQVNLLLDTWLASFLVTGSVSWLYLADRLVEFPLGIFAVALGTVILPRLSGEHASADGRAFSATLDWALRWMVLLCAPCAVGLIMLALPMMATLFQYGEFDVGDTLAAGLALVVYGAGLGGFMLVKITAPGYFARQDTKTPVRIGVVCVMINMVISAGSVLLFRHSPLGHLGLALGTVVAATVNGSMLLRGLKRRGVYTPSEGWDTFGRRIGAATLAMAALLYYPASRLDFWFSAGLLARAVALGMTILAAAAVYFLVLRLLGQSWRVLKEPQTR